MGYRAPVADAASQSGLLDARRRWGRAGATGVAPRMARRRYRAVRERDRKGPTGGFSPASVAGRTVRSLGGDDDDAWRARPTHCSERRHSFLVDHRPWETTMDRSQRVRLFAWNTPLLSRLLAGSLSTL
jgi:hypothetical protein